MKAKLIKIDNGWVLMVNNIMYATDNDKLSLKNCQAIENGYDLDELVKSVPHTCRNNEDLYKCRAGFIVGFQKALEILGDKKFSEEDVRKAIEIARKGSMQEQHNGYGMSTESRFILDNLSSDDIIQTLQQLEWDVFFNPDEKDSEGCLILKRLEL